MTGAQLASHWQTRGHGCGTVVGSRRDLAALAEQLAAAGVPVCRLGAALLQRIPEADSLAAAAESRALESAETARRAVAQAFETWLADTAGETGPLAVQDLELAVAERVELARLSELGRPVLVLAPGRLVRQMARLYATGPHDGLPLPPAIAPRDATWELSPDSEDGIPVESMPERESA